MTEADLLSETDTGLLGLVMVARYHGIAASSDELAHEFREDGQPFSLRDILLAANKLGLKAKSVRSDRSRLDRIPFPALAEGIDGQYLILARADNNQVLIGSRQTSPLMAGVKENPERPSLPVYNQSQ